jgi:hypothetical protein
MSKDTLILNVDHWLTKEEQAENAEKLAGLVHDRALADIRLKRISKLLKDQVAAFDDEITRISAGVLDGYINGDRKAYLVKCFVTQKRVYYDAITHDLLKIEPFTPGDKQLELTIDPADRITVPQVSQETIASFFKLEKEREARKQRNELEKQEELERVLLEAADAIRSKRQLPDDDDEEIYRVPSDQKKTVVRQLTPPGDTPKPNDLPF